MLFKCYKVVWASFSKGTEERAITSPGKTMCDNEQDADFQFSLKRGLDF